MTTEYVGSGDFASSTGRLEAFEREERRRQRAAEREERDRLDAEDRPIAELFHLVEIIARTTLEAAGYHRHHRSKWRKRRAMSTDPKLPVAPPAVPEIAEGDVEELIRRARAGDESVLPYYQNWLDHCPERHELFRRIRAGDESALPWLRRYLTDHPDTLRADMAAKAEEAVAAQCCSKDSLLAREAVLHEMRRLSDLLAGPDVSPVERLLARRASLCWHALAWYEYGFAKREAAGVTFAHGVYLQKRIDGAHKRFLQSVKTLELVRRLARPAASVSVNVEQNLTVEAAPPPPKPSRLTVSDLLSAAPRG